MANMLDFAAKHKTSLEFPYFSEKTHLIRKCCDSFSREIKIESKSKHFLVESRLIAIRALLRCHKIQADKKGAERT